MMKSLPVLCLTLFLLIAPGCKKNTQKPDIIADSKAMGLDQFIFVWTNSGTVDREDLPETPVGGGSLTSSSSSANGSSTGTLNASYQFGSGGEIEMFSCNSGGSVSGEVGHYAATAQLDFEVLDGDIAFHAFGNNVGPDDVNGFTIQKAENGGGYLDPPVLAHLTGSLDATGLLSPGEYRAKMVTVADVSINTSGSFNFTLELTVP